MSDAFTPDSGSAWLVRRAARRAPSPLDERLEEEWLADLAEQPSSFARLKFALGCCWATCVIAQDRRAATTALSTHNATAGDELGSRSMSFKWLWIAGAALAATALLVGAALLVPFAAREIAEGVLPLVGRLVGRSVQSISVALSFAVSSGLVLSLMAYSIHQIRRNYGANAGPKPPLGLLTLVLSATSGLLFAMSGLMGYIAITQKIGVRDLAGSDTLSLWGGAALFAVTGAGLLVVLSCAHRARQGRGGVRAM